MNKVMEKRAKKIFQAFPLRTNIVPKNITLDTTSIIHLFITKNKSEYLRSVSKHQTEIWSYLLNLKKRVFRRKGYAFNGMIKTNGISTSILLIKKPKTKIQKKKG